MLRQVRDSLNASGFTAVLNEPDSEDPPGGVLTVEAANADPVQVVNFEGRFPKLVTEAIANSRPMGDPVLGVRVPDLIRLIAFKVYAGGPKSALDVLELVDRNPSLDLGELRAYCKRIGLHRELKKVLPKSR